MPAKNTTKKPPAKGLQTAPDKRGKVKNCTPGKSFPCGKACLGVGSTILEQCLKGLKATEAQKAKNLGDSLKKSKNKAAKPEASKTQPQSSKSIGTKTPKDTKKTESSKPNGSLGTGMPTTPIKNYKDFEKAAIESLSNINYEYNEDNFIPIHRLRKDLKGRLTNEEFDDFMYEMQGNDKIQLMTSNHASGDEISEGVKSSFGDTRTHVKVLDKKDLKHESTRKNISKNPIKTAEEFEKEVTAIYDKLNKENNYDDLVPIYQVRREMGDRVTRGEFNNWLFETQANDKFQLQGGGVEDSARDKIEDSVTSSIGTLRAYMKKL